MTALPPCPGCGAETIVHGSPGGTWLETAHFKDCTWMADPNAEPYDEFDDDIYTDYDA